ncbi:AraC family transcriptional regulator [Acidisoma cellulosilytica]|uniref:AraC family transcriptional regulator n=1 Tax=Acidisoma cellulosilyticum TaxID=2802395 RepID=A0A964E5Q0_9PROT|nr:AraC family transcriptional regulator [Acidisoma cellulosilyticum]MCB8882749.1 AraC family transcriptional regulator [Acidisoma cellulosilyticum]
MDPLSDVLSLLKPQNYLSSGMAAEGAWSLVFPDQGESIKCGAVVSGGCWLALTDGGGEVYLEEGDAFLLPSGRSFRICTDRALPPVDALSIFKRQGNQAGRGSVTRIAGAMLPGQDQAPVSLVSSRFTLAGKHAHLLLRMLPSIVHIRHDRQGDLRWAVERMMQELREPQPGGFLIIEHLAHMILVQALRQHMRDKRSTSVGWLFALTDPQIGAAMNAMHEDPARRWTLDQLAALVGMSRSRFAQTFKETVGSAPMDYMARWRMLLAGERLTQSGEPVSVIALSLGYQSESAFSTAFKRIMGSSPRDYGRATAETILLPDQFGLVS